MSEPVTNVEIEDVLSSIRRLVTEEGRPKGRKAAGNPAAPAGRLVLTPALRVADTEETRPAAEPSGEDQSGQEQLNSGDFSHHSIYSRHAQPDEIQFRRRIEPESGAPADESAEAEHTLADPPWSDPDTTLHQAAARADEDGPAGEARGGPEEEIGPEDAGDGNTAGADCGEYLLSGPEPGAAPEPQAEEEPGTAAEAAGEGSGGSGEEQRHETRAATLSAKIQALEAAIAQTADQWEPDGELGDDYAGVPVKTLEWRDHGAHRKQMAERFETGADEPEGAEMDTGDRDAAVADGLSADDGFIDEDSLRELVADIVRQELQGALGERITRNVRKLVRREIHRALTTQEFD